MRRDEHMPESWMEQDGSTSENSWMVNDVNDVKVKAVHQRFCELKRFFVLPANSRNADTP